jgi:hypothetical protein
MISGQNMKCVAYGDVDQDEVHDAGMCLRNRLQEVDRAPPCKDETITRMMGTCRLRSKKERKAIAYKSVLIGPVKLTNTGRPFGSFLGIDLLY